ncbi:uncharacterized protein LOC135703676 [Ochlerotatus camptorhynchus]|uniref:uncharacterized protein LOC135703676 n=1 Tax=Ochlerotatus camptorhynchus TaxID=644619 RepID=UPI0031D96A76
MYYWPVNMETLKRTRKKPLTTLRSLVEMALKAYVLHLSVTREETEDLAEEMQHQPTQFIIDALEEMCDYPKLMKLQRQLLINPWMIDRILRSRSDNKAKLVKCFQWLEVFDRTLVSDMVANYCYKFRKESIRNDSHLLGYEGSLRLGTFLSETGWHNEAVKVLNVARQQANQRPLQQLNAMRPQLISQTYVWHPSAYDTSASIQTLIAKNNEIPKSFLASLYLAISICRYENYNFTFSHEFALMALELLVEGASSNRLIIEVLCHLAKTCVSQKQPRQAKLMITQAVSRAWHNYGPSSVIYAETLEDYAFYLVMMNSLDDSYAVFSEAVNVLLQVYGPQNLQRSVTKGNLSFDFYFNCAYIYSDLHMAKDYVRTQIEMNAFDHRLVAAAKHVYVLLEADMARFGAVRDCDQMDKYQPVQEQLSVKEVKKLFVEMKDEF